MRHIFIFTIILLIATSCSQECDCLQLKQVKGVSFIEGEGDPFTGICQSDIYGFKKEIEYENGKIEGSYASWN